MASIDSGTLAALLAASFLLACPGCGGKQGADDPSGADDTGPTQDSPGDSSPDTDTDTGTDTDTAPPDADGDGQTTADGDCDDADPGVYSGATDTDGDGIDANCDGIDSSRAVQARDIAAARPVGDPSDNGGNRAGTLVAVSADASGDGRPDVYTSGPNQGWDAQYPNGLDATVWLLAGTAQGELSLSTASTASWVWESAHFDFGEAPDAAGDVDGDGFGDVLVGAGMADGGRGFAGVYAGRLSGPSTVDAAIFSVTQREGDWLGETVRGNFDANGDGLKDILVESGGETFAFEDLTLGAVTTDDADLVLDGVVPNPAVSGPDLTGGPDMDGDGYDDLLLYPMGGGRVWIASGPLRSGAVPNSLFDISSPASGHYSYGDVNGDHALDLAFMSTSPECAWEDAGCAAVFLGPLAGSHGLTDAAMFLNADREDGLRGGAVSIAGDLDGDGDDEIVVGDTGFHTSTTGAVVLFLDPWAGSTTTAQADLVLDGASLGGYFGRSLSTAGDLDGDGLDDLVVGAPVEENAAGAVYLIHATDILASLAALP